MGADPHVGVRLFLPPVAADAGEGALALLVAADVLVDGKADLLHLLHCVEVEAHGGLLRLRDRVVPVILVFRIGSAPSAPYLHCEAREDELLHLLERLRLLVSELVRRDGDEDFAEVAARPQVEHHAYDGPAALGRLAQTDIGGDGDDRRVGVLGVVGQDRFGEAFDRLLQLLAPVRHVEARVRPGVMRQRRHYAGQHRGGAFFAQRVVEVGLVEAPHRPWPGDVERTPASRHAFRVLWTLSALARPAWIVVGA